MRLELIGPDRRSVQLPIQLRTVVEAHDGDVDCRSIQNPGLVGPRQEDVPDSLMRCSTPRLAPPRIPCVASRPARFARPCSSMGPGLLEPVADEVGFGRHPAVISAEQGIDVLVAQLFPQQLTAQERRVADDELCWGPFGLPRFGSVAVAQDGVGLSNGDQRGQDGLLGVGKAVVLVPLDITDPQGGAGQLGSVGVNLQPYHLVWLDPG